jgi:hypothetical protein
MLVWMVGIILAGFPDSPNRMRMSYFRSIFLPLRRFLLASRPSVLRYLKKNDAIGIIDWGADMGLWHASVAWVTKDAGATAR